MDIDPAHILIRRANCKEYKLLSDLALNSKSYWNYTDEFIHACREELRYSAEDIQNTENHFAVAEYQNRIVGFYALVMIEDNRIEMEALFIDRGFIGRGIGKALFKDAKSIAADKGVKSIIIQSDPNAIGFYESVGCIIIGEKESASIPGRYLPMLSFEIRK